MANKELKFTDNLKKCVYNENKKSPLVEIFLVNGIKLIGNITYASENLIVIGSKSKGYSNINPIAIATYMIEPNHIKINRLK